MSNIVEKGLRYETYGPFSFNPGENHRKTVAEFWSTLEANNETKGLGEAIGVYVWTYKSGKKRIPWNVGLTDRGFRRRFGQKENSFLRLLRDMPEAKIEVFILALKNRAGGFRRAPISGKVSTNDWLETLLLGSAISVNPEIRNKAKLKKLKTVVVDGYLSDDKALRSSAAKQFSEIFKA